MADPAFRIDHLAVRRNFSRRAAASREVSTVPREIAARMRERLDYIRLVPSRILDLGCGTGPDREWLAERFPEALQVGVDFSVACLRQQVSRPAGLLGRIIGRPGRPPNVAADAAALPFATRSFSMVWSNLLLNWVDDPRPLLAEMARVLEIDGMVMFSTLGPDTLQELRAALPETSVHRFLDMHDIGDALVESGFGDPVMDMQKLTVTYTRHEDLLRDLRLGGHANARSDRPRGLAGKHRWQLAVAKLEAQRREGRLPVTLELVFGHAWKAAPKTDAQGRAVIRFERHSPR